MSQGPTGLRSHSMAAHWTSLVDWKNVPLLPALVLVTQLFRLSDGAFYKTYLSKTSHCSIQLPLCDSLTPRGLLARRVYLVTVRGKGGRVRRHVVGNRGVVVLLTNLVQALGCQPTSGRNEVEGPEDGLHASAHESL
eukprot:4556402-Amphidinium_carterae.1